MQILLSPPLAFLIYIPIITVVVLVGRAMAGKQKASAMKSSIYGSGEAAPTNMASPGYRPFFLVAFFFAVLHLGILVLGSSETAPAVIIYLIGLIIALVALILG